MPNDACQILVHLYWPVADPCAAPLTIDALQRLPSYVMRYGETLGSRVHGVGGAPDHLHVVLTLPRNKTLQSIEDELQRATQRFLRDVGGSRTFAWLVTGNRAVGVSLSDREAVVGYVSEQELRHASLELWADFEAAEAMSVAVEAASTEEELPDWLRKAMRGES